MNTQELIKNISRGDSEVFKKLYREYFNMVRYFIVNNSGTLDDAEDIFQDAMIVIYEKTCDPNFSLTSSIKTYLYSVVRNLWLNKLRQKKTVQIKDFEQFIEIEQEDNEIEIKEERFNAIEKAIHLLGEKCRKIIQLFYYQQKSMQEIATELAYTNAANAKNQKYKCLQQLKKLSNE